MAIDLKPVDMSQEAIDARSKRRTGWMELIFGFLILFALAPEIAFDPGRYVAYVVGATLLCGGIRNLIGKRKVVTYIAISIIAFIILVIFLVTIASIQGH
jgi:hypothetical protein